MGRPSRRFAIHVSAWVILGIAGLPAGAEPPTAADEPRIVRPDYRRERPERRAVPREITAREIPGELRLEIVEEPARKGHDSPGRVERADETAREAEIARRARQAGVWAAEAVVMQHGRREYFRVGFYEGLRAALADPRVGGRDFEVGERRGRLDMGALAAGAQLGDEAAERLARTEAEARVAAQFANLAAAPRFDATAVTPRFTPRPYAPAPTLDEVLVDFAPQRVWGLRDTVAVMLDGWTQGPVELAHCDSYTEFYDAGWREPRAAFDFWAESRSRTAWYRELRVPAERRRFATTFEAAFARRLAELFPRELLPAYDDGFHAGFDYGVFVHEELDYRRGYHAGFIAALDAAARVTFQRAYPRAFRRAYDESFDDWSRNPKPQIGSVTLIDGNDDGIFEPGESFRVAYELINYGGAPGRLPLELRGGVLAAPASTWVDLPAREVVSGDAVRGRVLVATAPRTDARLELKLAEVSRELPLHVAYPLQLQRGAWQARRHNLEGQVRLEIAVDNLSRRASGAELVLTATTLPGFELREPVGSVEPGGTRRLTLTVGGLDPLDLLAGAVALDLRLERGDTVLDRDRRDLPDAARDLSNRDLLVFSVRLAHERADDERVVLARDLLMQRLRADWRAAVVANGNPYKSDFKRSGSRTALGELVELCRAEGATVREQPIFAGLSTDVIALSGELPGAHPFLRKYMRRLARRLP